MSLRLRCHLLQKSVLRRRERQEQSHGFVYDRPQSVAVVERGCLFVLGVNQQSKRSGCILKSPVYGIHQHQLAETTPLKASVYRQPSNPDRRQCGVARQPFGFLNREIQWKPPATPPCSATTTPNP